MTARQSLLVICATLLWAAMPPPATCAVAYVRPAADTLPQVQAPLYGPVGDDGLTSPALPDALRASARRNLLIGGGLAGGGLAIAGALALATRGTEREVISAFVVTFAIGLLVLGGVAVAIAGLVQLAIARGIRRKDARNRGLPLSPRQRRWRRLLRWGLAR